MVKVHLVYILAAYQNAKRTIIPTHEPWNLTMKFNFL